MEHPLRNVLYGIGSGILILALAVFFFVPSVMQMFVSAPAQPAPDPQVIPQAQELYKSGDYLNAKKVVQDFVDASTPTTPGYRAAKHLQENLAFETARTKDDRLDAIKIALERYDEVTAKERKAGQVTRLVSYALSAFEPYLLNAIFDNPDFKSLRADGHMPSLMNLSEYSVSIYPTSLGVIYVERTGTIEWIYNHASQVADPKIKAELKTRTANMLSELKKARDLYAYEEAHPEIFPVDVSGPAIHMFWVAYLTAAASFDDPSRLADAEKAFQKVYAYYEANNVAPLKRQAVYTHISHAMFLTLIGGDARKADIKTQLDALATLLKGDVNNEPRLKLLMQNLRTLKDVYATHQHNANGLNLDSTDENDTWMYGVYVKWAGISPNFKALMEQAGWVL